MKNKKMKDLLERTEKIQEELTGIESSNDFDEIEAYAKFNERELRVSQKMLPIFVIEEWICDGTLNLQPEYQRNLVWDAKRKSALIESILLNIPIPAFYFDEDCNGIKNVMDGLQRLSTIHQYIKGEFSLKNLQYLEACEQKCFHELDNRYRTKIFETLLMVNILDERCSPMIKMDIFRRVNTGGIHLNPQEIRNILAKTEVRNLLKNMSTCDEFTCATREKVNDIRMGAQELCLRYVTLFGAYNWKKHEFDYYQGLLKMMDSCMLELNKKNSDELNSILGNFKKVMKQCYSILGEYSFCKVDNNRKIINKALFTSWAIVVEHLDLEDAVIVKNKDKIMEKYLYELQNNKVFYDSITSSTGSRKYILYAIEIIRGIMEGYYDCKDEIKKL